MFKNLGAAELIIVFVVLLVSFGNKKVNELARGLGKSTKDWQKIRKELQESINLEEEGVE